MAEKAEDADLDTLVEQVLASSRPPRGRPPSGFTKALTYAARYFDLRELGMPRWQAKVEVASEFGLTVEHVAACVKRVNELPSFKDLFEIDQTKDA